MDEDVSVSFRISIVVWMTGALVCIVAGVLSLTLSVLNNYVNKYADTMVMSAENTIVSLVGVEAVPGAIVYKNIEASIESIDAVLISTDNDGNYNNDTLIYKYDTVDFSGLMSLMTIHKNDKYVVNVVNGIYVPGLKTVVLVEVE